MTEHEVDVAAHRDSYPMGNIHHGTPERPDWGTFCVECKQSWPCDVSLLATERDAALAALDRVKALAGAAEAREAMSLSRTFDGGSFGAWVDAAALSAAVEGGRS